MQQVINLNVMCFCFDFIRSHAWYGCCFIICLCFQVVQIKQVNCQMSTKNVNNCKYKTFQMTIADILANGPFEEVPVVITEDDEQLCRYFVGNT